MLVGCGTVVYLILGVLIVVFVAHGVRFPGCRGGVRDGGQPGRAVYHQLSVMCAVCTYAFICVFSCVIIADSIIV